MTTRAQRTPSSSRPSLERKQCSTSSSRNPCVVLVRRRRRLSPSSRSHAHAPVVRAPVVHAGPRVRGSAPRQSRVRGPGHADAESALVYVFDACRPPSTPVRVPFLNIRSVYPVYNVCKKGKKGSLRNRDFLSISSQDFYGTYPVFEKVSAAVSVIEAPVARSDG